MTKQFYFKQFVLAYIRSSNIKTVLFQGIQFNISTQLSFILPTGRTILGATTPGQSGPRSNGNEEVLCILQSSSITRTSPLDCLVLYPGHTLGGVLPLC